MKIKARSYSLVVLFAIAISMTFDANALEHTSLGSPTCKSWVNDINTVTDKTNMHWITGYVSGLSAVFSLENKIDLLEDIDGKTIFLWTDKFCTENPNRQVSGAGDTYILEVMKQKMPHRKNH